MSFINSLFGSAGGGIFAGVLALVIVIALIVFLVWALKVLLEATGRVGRGSAKRLSIVETTAIDQKRQLVLVRRDNVEHLLLIGGVSELLIESKIPLEKISISNNKKTEKQNQKDMNKLSSKIKSTLAKSSNVSISGGSIDDVSLRHSGLLRRSDSEDTKINPQTFDENSLNHGHLNADSDRSKSDADIFFIEDIDVKDKISNKSGKSGVAKTTKKTK